MSQVLQQCEACGKVETSLIDGLCPQCRRSGGIPPPKAPDWVRRAGQITALSPRPSAYARPSEFLFFGIIAEVVGFACLLAAQSGRTPLAFLLAIVGALLAIAGGVLVTVGAIRWAIWPLIEKAEHRD